MDAPFDPIQSRGPEKSRLKPQLDLCLDPTTSCLTVALVYSFEPHPANYAVAFMTTCEEVKSVSQLAKPHSVCDFKIRDCG